MGSFRSGLLQFMFKLETKTYLIIAIVGMLVLGVLSSLFGPSDSSNLQTPSTVRVDDSDRSGGSDTFRTTTEVSNVTPITTKGTYEVLYIDDFDEYLITVTESPFDDFRTVAEQGFIKSLGITEEEACGLNVKIATPLFANPDEAGVEYGLSFCE